VFILSTGSYQFVRKFTCIATCTLPSANSLNRLDRETKEGFQRVMAPLKNKMTYKDANEKVNIAFNEFEHYNKLNDKGDFPKLMYG
jgi:hypothetical protein